MKQNFGEYVDLHIKPLGEPGEQEEPQESVSTKLEMERRQSSQDIARRGGYENILVELENKKLLDEQIDCFKKTYRGDIESIVILTDNDWEALTILELYDTGTFLHSLETCRIAKEIIEQQLHFGDEPIMLSEKIKEEGMVSLEQFYRACLLHDIGKVEVPHFIITSGIEHAEWAEMLVTMNKRNPEEKLLENILAQANVTIPPDVSMRPAGNEKDALLVELLKDNHVRCEKYVPIEEAVGNPLLGDRALTERNVTDLESRNLAGLTRKSPLFDIIKIHEPQSATILREDFKPINPEDAQNLEKIAKLVGSHHDYDGSHAKLIENFPITISSFRVSVMLSEIISFADMFQAIKSKRTYKSAENELEALWDVSRSVDEKNNQSLYFVAYLIISNELKSLETFFPNEHESIKQLRAKMEQFSDKAENRLDFALAA